MRSLDASALLALIRREPGAETVARLIRGALLSAVNYAEVVGSLTRGGASPESAHAAIATFPLVTVDLDVETARRIGALEPLTRFAGLSLGDRACLAQAELRKVPALTADRVWRTVGERLGIEVELIR